MRNSKRGSGTVLDGIRGILARIPQTPRALRRRGQEYLAAGNVTEASRLASRLVRIDPWRGAHLQGEILLHSEPQGDHTEFWADAAARFPADTDLVRKTVHAALKAGKFELAEAGIRNLTESGRARAQDSNFVVGLANFYSQQAKADKIRALVRQFLRSLRGKPDHRIAAVRLSRFIFLYFPPQSPEVASDSRRRQFLNILERSAVEPKPKAILRRVVAMERALALSAPEVLLDTDISEAQCRKFIARVHDNLASGKSFSFIRVGDGESSSLAYEPHLAGLARADAAEREHVWWGGELGESDRTKLSAQVSSAIWNADCLGVPTVSRILRDIRLSGNDDLDGGRVGRGLRSVVYTFENVESIRARHSHWPLFTSCHLHQDLARWDLYPTLFEGVREVVLVSCHPGLADIVEQRFAVSIAGNILVPPRHASIPLLRERLQTSRALPQIIGDVEDRLDDLPRGRLVLVGAGYLGKRLIDVAKRRGGVALDLGSILDHWVGVSTRSYLDLALN